MENIFHQQKRKLNTMKINVKQAAILGGVLIVGLAIGSLAFSGSDDNSSSYISDKQSEHGSGSSANRSQCESDFMRIGLLFSDYGDRVNRLDPTSSRQIQNVIDEGRDHARDARSVLKRCEDYASASQIRSVRDLLDGFEEGLDSLEDTNSDLRTYGFLEFA